VGIPKTHFCITLLGRSLPRWWAGVDAELARSTPRLMGSAPPGSEPTRMCPAERL